MIFGDGAAGDQELTDLLEKLLAEANRLPGPGGSDRYYESRPARALPAGPGAGTLISRFADAPQSDRTRVVQQISHWLFATRDTLGSNAFRALGAIVADQSVERRVREELGGIDPADPAPSTASATRGLPRGGHATLADHAADRARDHPKDHLAGEKIDEGTQVVLINVATTATRTRCPAPTGSTPSAGATAATTASTT